MAVRIVDLFEMIDINHGDRNRATVATVAIKFLVQRFKEVPAGRHARKQVRVHLRLNQLIRAGEHLTYRFTTVEKGLTLRRYWTGACHECAIRDRCTEGKERRITRWEHEHVVEAAERRLDENPQAVRTRRNTVEYPFGTIKSWMCATHFQMRTLKKVSTEMALHVLASNLKRVMSILGIGPLIAAIRVA